MLPSVFTMNPFDMLRTSPFDLMRRFTEEMDHYFARLGMGRSEPGRMAADSGIFFPPVEVAERDGNLIVCADLPGLTKDDVRVEITEDVLTIEGERHVEHEEKQAGVVRSERSYGRFHRQIPLPEGAHADQATASFKDGVLEVSMPMPQRQTQGRRIEIQSGVPRSTGHQEASRTEHQASHGMDQEHAQTTTGRA
jgi:HSP20 family protein